MNETILSALSTEGQARRDLMIGEVVEMAHRRYRRRRMLRIVSATTCVVATVAALVLVWPVASGLDRPSTIAIESSGANEPSAHAAQPITRPQRVLRIQTDPTVLGRYSHVSADHIMRMDDRMLMATLDSINRPAQLIDNPNGVRLSAPVTDAELGL